MQDIEDVYHKQESQRVDDICNEGEDDESARDISFIKNSLDLERNRKVIGCAERRVKRRRQRMGVWERFWDSLKHFAWRH